MIDFLFVTWLAKPLWMWLSFIAVVLVLLAFDLGVLHRHNRALGLGESLLLSAFYVAVAMIFGGVIWWAYARGLITTSDGSHAGMVFFTGYFLEKMLSVDNVFVISLIFGYFAIPRKYQYRALLWGILAVIVLRGIMIGFGAALVQRYDWVLLIFGAFLVFTGLRMLFGEEREPDIAGNPVIRFMKRHMRVSDRLHGEKFFVREQDARSGRMVIVATPLFLALAVINVADLIFAVDSVPAIFAITTDTYIVYTANIMAILGLRALYFALAALVHRFDYLQYALALVLVFIGAKVFWVHAFGKVDPAISLTVTLSILAGGVFFSLWKTARAGSSAP
ncbi:MAG: TerC family protein [Salinarimonas sp.]|nr:TerC family protein [Salinarimonas sp.]